VALAEKHDLEMPIATAVRDVLERTISVGEAVEALLARPLTSEE
jgi:glycerol-3-phosphate dehydrogenase